MREQNDWDQSKQRQDKEIVMDAADDRANTNPAVGEAAVLQRHIKSGRSSLLLIAILSCVNVAMVLLDYDLGFAFSLSSPTILQVVGVELGNFFGSSVLPFVFTALAFLIIGLFFIFYFLSKKYVWPVIAALVLFSLDTLVLIWLIFVNMNDFASFIVEIVFHIWAISSLARLLSSTMKLKKLAL